MCKKRLCFLNSWIVFLFPLFLQSQNPVVENLGPACNSAFSEINPIISPDGKNLFFVREIHPGNLPNEAQEIWLSASGSDGRWAEAKRMDPPFNLARFNSVQSISPDGMTILIRGVFKKGKPSGKGFSLVQRTTTGWGDPQKLIISGLDEMDKGKYNGAFLANDGKTLLLYFSEDPFDDQCDLYVSFNRKGDQWSRPVPLGPAINGDKSDEISPFLASDGRTLYFSSNRKGSLGSNDIYLARREGKGWTKWSDPVNLGSPVNSEGWEAYYSIAASGDFAYMTSTRNSLGREDLIRIRLNEQQKPKPVVLVKGFLKDAKTGKAIEADISYQVLPEGTEAGVARSDPNDGSYQIVLPYGARYAFSARAEGFFAISDFLDLSTIGQYSEVDRPLTLVPIEVGSIVRLNNIFFETARSDIREESIPEIERVAGLMKENPAMEIEISGHTDDVGAESLNLELSEARAAAVKSKLEQAGIQANRIQSKGYGETRPVAENETESGRAANRRVEFIILKK